MKRTITIFISACAMIAMAQTGFSDDRSLCPKSDADCKEFETLAAADRFDVIISRIDGTKKYSDGSRHLIGKAYLALAANEKNTPEQEETYCRKALEFGAAQAYMGLYFLYVQKNEEQALGYLREYVKTQPRDSVPYVILGESELNKKNYERADSYLREARRVSRARSPRVAWMLFQANYLIGNFQFAAEMMGSALENGDFDKELKALSADPRFQGIEKRPELKKYLSRISAAGQ